MARLDKLIKSFADVIGSLKMENDDDDDDDDDDVDTGVTVSGRGAMRTTISRNRNES